MKSHPLLERISIDPRVCFGKPTVRGTRIWVSLILDLLAGGMTMGELLRSIHSSRRRTFEQPLPAALPRRKRLVAWGAGPFRAQ